MPWLDPDPRVSADATPRQRLLAGLGAALIETELSEVTVADIVREARTSRRTFYECFSSKAEAFVELVHTVNARRRESVLAAIDPDADPVTQINTAITALLQTQMLDSTAFARAMRAVHSLGEQGRPLVRSDVQDFTALLRGLADTPALRSAGIVPPDHDTAVIVVAGVRELIITAIEDGRDLDELTEPITRIVARLLLPDS